MAGYGPSTSGRVCDGVSAFKTQSLRSCAVTRPLQERFSRRGARHRVVSCDALALPGRLQLLTTLHRLFRSSPATQAEALYLEVEDTSERHESSHVVSLSLVRRATVAAIQVGVRLTSIALWLAKTVVEDLRRSVRRVQVQQQVQQQATEARSLLNAESLKYFEASRETLRLRAKDVAFMRMLHVLDRSHMDHDAKWALVQKHTADKADFCERLQQLYKAASASKEAVERSLRPDASRQEINHFWKSKQTAALIAEEESLKQLVFAQMLQAS